MDHASQHTKKPYSTKTTLLKINKDLFCTRDMNNNQCVLLVMLDRGAAFDTVNQNILQAQMDALYGVRGGAIKWQETYLSNRTQSVIDYVTLEAKTLKN